MSKADRSMLAIMSVGQEAMKPLCSNRWLGFGAMIYLVIPGRVPRTAAVQLATVAGLQLRH